MLRNGYYSKGHSDRTPKSSKMFAKGRKPKMKNYERAGLDKGKIYTEESYWIKIFKLFEILAAFGVIGYLSYLILTFL